MNPRILLLMASCFLPLVPGRAQNSVAVETASPETPPIATAALRTPQQLETLLAPIALYPDALLALILPASTAASDLVLASRYLSASGDIAQIDAQPWDESVKSLVHYPEVVTWMDENLAWTKQVGEAFLTQPADVMNAIQRLRAQARAAGTLVDTPQQQVVVDGSDLDIIPTQADTIYVPRYNPDVVYVRRYYQPPYAFLTFGPAYATGLWLNFDFDWRQHRVWVVDRHLDWRDHRDWRHPDFPGRPGYVSDPNRHPWRPPSNDVRPPWTNLHGVRPDIVRPDPLPGTPPRPAGWTRNGSDRGLVSTDSNQIDHKGKADRDAPTNRGPNNLRPGVPVAPTPLPVASSTFQPRPAQPQIAAVGPTVSGRRSDLDQSQGERRERPRREIPEVVNPVPGPAPGMSVTHPRIQPPSVPSVPAAPVVSTVSRPEFVRPPPPVQSSPPAVSAPPVAAPPRAPVASESARSGRDDFRTPQERE